MYNNNSNNNNNNSSNNSNYNNKINKLTSKNQISKNKLKGLIYIDFYTKRTNYLFCKFIHFFVSVYNDQHLFKFDQEIKNIAPEIELMEKLL